MLDIIFKLMFIASKQADINMETLFFGEFIMILQHIGGIFRFLLEPV